MGPIHPHLTDSIKRSAEKKKKAGGEGEGRVTPDSRAKVGENELFDMAAEVNHIVLYKIREGGSRGWGGGGQLHHCCTSTFIS